jgi:murein DD-endopeptidase MepM/ murein hydrolase activator NlpD
LISHRIILFSASALVLILTGCSTKLKDQLPTVEPEPTIIFTSPPTETPTNTPTLIPTATSTPDPAAGFAVSSPLADIQLPELVSIMSEPFERPAPGMDDKHHGTDFSYYSHGSHGSILGLPIYSMLNGTIAATTSDKDPYGNLIIIETPLNTIPKNFLALLSPPSALSPYPYNPRMVFCPNLKSQNWEENVESLYILYAHMKEPALLQPGDKVASGDQLGFVGNTGLSGNPHLHLEMRWGPVGTKFASMAYYDTSATESEMTTFCNWRISGRYVLEDPMVFIQSWLDTSK